MRRRLPRSGVFVSFLVAVAILVPGLSGDGVSWDERFGEYIPWRMEAARLIRAGEFPFYTDRLGAGMPLHSTGYVGVLYPPNLLYLMLDPLRAAKVLEGLHALLALAGMYSYLRTRRLGRPASMVGAGAFATNTFLLFHGAHVSMCEAASLAPWVALAARRLCLRPSGRRTALLAGALALQVSTGYAQMVLITLGWVAVEWLASSGEIRFGFDRMRGGKDPRGRTETNRARVRVRFFLDFTTRLGRAAGGLIVAGLVAGLLMGVQIVPTLRHTPETPRADLTLSEWQQESLDPANPIIFANPWARTGIQEQGMTLQASALALMAAGCLMALFARKRLSPLERSFFAAALPVALLSVLLAFGKYFPPNALLFHVPPFNLFRIPSRWLLLVCALGSVAAAMGFEALRRMTPWVRAAVFSGAWALWAVALALIAAAASATSDAGETLRAVFGIGGAWQARWAVGAVAAALVPVLLARRFPWVAAMLFLGILLAEHRLLFVRSTVVVPSRPLATLHYDQNPFFRSIPREEIGRFLTHEIGETIATVNLNLYLGLPSALVYCPLLNHRLERTLRFTPDGRWRGHDLVRNAAPLRTLAVTHVLFPESELPPASDPDARAGAPHEILIVAEDKERSMALCRVRDTPPRYDFAASWAKQPRGFAGASLADDRVWAESPPVAERQVLIANASYRRFPPPDTPLPRGSVKVVRDGASRKTLRVETPEAAVLLIRDVYWPGWRYRILAPDGNPLGNERDVHEAQGVIQAVPVPGGSWLVELRYRPPDWRTALTLSVLGLAGLVGLLVAPLRWVGSIRRRPQSKSSGRSFCDCVSGWGSEAAARGASGPDGAAGRKRERGGGDAMTGVNGSSADAAEGGT